MKILPAEQIGVYLSAAEEHGVLPMFYLELTTGLRRGELTALLWTDLDVEARTLRVSKSAGRLKGEVRVTEPKTANSVRTIILPKETVDLLVQEHAKHPENPYMFPSPVTGKMYGPDCIGRLHKTLLKKAGITENIPFHGLRHTFATLAIQQGWTSKRCPASWAITARGSRWTPTPTSPGRCARRPLIGWGSSSPKPSEKRLAVDLQ